MRKHTWILASAAALLLALGGLFLAAARSPDDDKEEIEKMMKAAAAKEAVLKLVGAIDGGAKVDDAKKLADEIGKKHEIGAVMNQFKPREKYGLGVGDKPDSIQPDAIELKLIALGNPKKLIPKAELTAQQTDLVKIAEVSLAIGYIAPSYAANEGRKGAEIKEWNKDCEDMQKGSQGLIDALKSGDPKKVQDAANRLNASCNSCHTGFRDKE
jgi:cytochrome c556